MYTTVYIKDRLRHIMEVMLPIFITQMAIIGMGFIDTVMAGHVGAADLAGVAIGANLWMPVFTGLNGILLAVLPLVAQHLGAGRRDDIGKVVTNGIFLAILIGVSLVAVIWLGAVPGLRILGLEPAVERVAVGFLKGLSWGIVPIFVVSVLRGFVDTLGHMKMTMRIFLLILPVTLLLNYLLIFGKFGFPRLGGIGAGYAMAISYILVLFMYLALLVRVPAIRQLLPRFDVSKFSPVLLWEFLRVGVPIGVAIFLESSIFGIIVFFMVKFGTVVIAAHQAAINFTGLLYMLPLSFSLTLTILVGIKVGAGEYEEAKAYGRIGVGANLALALLFMLGLALWREKVAELYSSDPQIIKLAGEFLFYSACFQLLEAIATPIQGILRGYKDVKSAFYASLLAYWVICLPLGYYFDAVWGQGIFSYWQSLITGILVSAVFLFFRLRQIEKKYKFS